MEQEDIKLGVAESKEIKDYRDSTGEGPLWSNSMFSGMPTFQINIEHKINLLCFLRFTTGARKAIGKPILMVNQQSTLG